MCVPGHEEKQKNRMKRSCLKSFSITDLWSQKEPSNRNRYLQVKKLRPSGLVGCCPKSHREGVGVPTQDQVKTS